jgi:hypothetical protein
MCGAGGTAPAELLFETEFWDFYYCRTCGHWFQASATDPKVASPVKRKGHERALMLMYNEKIEQMEGIQNTGAALDRIWRKVVLLTAKVYLKISRLNEK